MSGVELTTHGAQPELTYLAVHDPRYGGSIYERQVLDAVAGAWKTSDVDCRSAPGPAQRWRTIARCRLRERELDPDIWLRPDLATIGASRSALRRSIAMIHHVDRSMGVIPGTGAAIERLLRRTASRSAAVVTVSEHWRAELTDWGIDDVRVIHNSFDPSAYVFSQEDTAALRQKLALDPAKPLVYVGNAQRLKGSHRVAAALRSDTYELIATGVQDGSCPVRTVFLDHGDYRCLLAASDVVLALSTMPEGWSRTAHEALLAGTPVIGSGAGGMRELLDGAGQTIVGDADDVAEAVDQVVEGGAGVSAAAYDYASSFTQERFRAAWLDLLQDIAGVGRSTGPA